MYAKVILALALGLASADRGLKLNNGWLKNARISTRAEVNDCKLNGVKSLNLGGTFECDLNDETVLGVDYDYNDLNNGDLPREVSVKWNRDQGSTSYNVDANLNLVDKSGTAEVTVRNGDVTVRGNLDSSRDNYLESAEASYNVDMSGRNVQLTPSWNVQDNKGHLQVNTDLNSDCGLELNVDMNADPDASLRVEYRVNENNQVAPEINLRDGRMKYEYTRKLNGGSEVVANVEPSKNVNIEWKDSAARGAWTTSINVPWNNAADSDISFKRNFDL